MLYSVSEVAEIAKQHEAEIARLHEFILRVSDKLFLAAEVLSIRAERAAVRGVQADLPSGSAR